MQRQKDGNPERRHGGPDTGNLEDREGVTGSMNTTARNEGNVSRKGAKLKWWALGQEADWGMEEMRKLSNRQHLVDPKTRELASEHSCLNNERKMTTRSKWKQIHVKRKRLHKSGAWKQTTCDKGWSSAQDG